MFYQNFGNLFFTEWFRCRHINPKSLNPDWSELLQRPLWFNWTFPTALHTQEVMDTLAVLQITNFEQFLRKKSSTDHPLVNRLAHYLPVHWLRTDSDKIMLEITLYEGVITKKQTYKRLVELKLMGHSPRALLTWPGDLNITVDEFNPAWYKSCTRISQYCFTLFSVDFFKQRFSV